MPQILYLSTAYLPQQRKVYSRAGQTWHLMAVVIHLDRESGQETGRTAFLRRTDGKGREWETPWESLDTAVTR